jgi:hypothetical protein
MMSLHRYCSWLTGLVLTLSYVVAVAQNTIELQPDKGLLVIDSRPFTLQGSTVIDPDHTCRTPTGDWTCGQAAWRALEGRARNGVITCTPLVSLMDSTTAPVLAECTVNNENLNAWLVRHGWALSDNTPSALFVSEEKAAQTEQLGIWRGGFVPPSHWRAQDVTECNACTARHQSIVRARELRQQSSPANNSN